MRPRRCGAAISPSRSRRPAISSRPTRSRSAPSNRAWSPRSSSTITTASPQGQPLARLDTARLQDTIVQAQAGLASAQAQVATAQASAAQARANLARQEEVFRVSGGRVPSETELDAARAENRRARRRRARRRRRRSRQARAQLSSAQTNLSKATIYSPVTGVVLSRQIDPGQTVAASLPGAGPVHHRRGSGGDEARGPGRRGRCRPGPRRASAPPSPSTPIPAGPSRRVVTRVDVGANASGSTIRIERIDGRRHRQRRRLYRGACRSQNPRAAASARHDRDRRDRHHRAPQRPARPQCGPALVARARRRGAGGAAGRHHQRAGAARRRGAARGGAAAGASARSTIGRGSRQTVYVLGADGKPRRSGSSVGESNGSETEITGGDLREGMEVITARLAAGQTQEKSERGRGRGGRDGGDGDEAAPAPNQAARAGRRASAARRRPRRRRRGPRRAPPAAGRRPPPAPRQPAAPRGAAAQRMRDMTPGAAPRLYGKPDARAARGDARAAPAAARGARAARRRRRPMANEPIISLRGVTKTYGSGATAFQALKGIDLDVAAGDFVAVMGPSGSGKSTAMNILGCLDVPTTRLLPLQGRAGRDARPRPARLAAPPLSRLRLPGLQPARPHRRARECRAALALSRRGQGEAPRNRRWRRSTRSASTTGGTIRRPSFPAASSSASPSPARSSPIPTCCSPTSRPAISTARPRSRSWTC